MVVTDKPNESSSEEKLNRLIDSLPKTRVLLAAEFHALITKASVFLSPEQMRRLVKKGKDSLSAREFKLFAVLVTEEIEKGHTYLFLTSDDVVLLERTSRVFNQKKVVKARSELVSGSNFALMT